MRICKCVHALRGSARPHRRFECVRQVVRRVPVVGELCRILVIDRRIRVRESVGEPPMKTGALARQEFAVDGLLKKRVAEDERLPGARIERNEDVSLDRLPKISDEIRFITFRDAREETRRHPRPGG